MRNLASFVKTTVVGGFFVVVPVVLAFLIVDETLELVVVIADPIADLFPIEGLEPETEKTLVGILLIVLISFLTGLATRTEIGARFGGWVEGLVLERLPGYKLFKSVSRRFAGDERDARFLPAVVTTPFGTRMLAFIVEEHENGDMTVFIPSAPTPAVGAIHIVGKEQVRKLDVPITSVATCFWEFGMGAGQLLASPAADPQQRRS